MKKKAAAPEPAGESAPMWIVSFADLVTLMMSFFVVLYALKQGGAKQQKEVAAAIRAAFDSSVPSPDSTDEFDMMIRRAKGLPGPPYQNTGGNAADPTSGAKGANPEVQTIRAGKTIVTGGKISFAAGEAQLDPGSSDTIRQIAGQVRGLNNVLMIKGHASVDELVARPEDADGLALSYQRAMLVVEALEKMGVDRRILRPVACGDFEPVKTGVYDVAGQRQNRRVEVFTTDYTASEYFPVNTVPATTQASRKEAE